MNRVLQMVPVLILGTLLLAGGRCVAGTELPVGSMTVSDCAKCHPQITAVLLEAGAAHRDSVDCLDCHRGHPPRDLEIIPSCSACHQGSPHFDRHTPCLACHRDPHRPLEIVPAREALDACFDCHPGVRESFASAPSLHARFACSSCHESHGQAFPCQECHQPHAWGAEPQNCRGCHPPHAPMAIVIGGEADPAICLSCHLETGSLLELSATAHRQVGCTSCHAGGHGTIPACTACHLEPHPSRMLARFPQCRQCHGDAHSLKPGPL